MRQPTGGWRRICRGLLIAGIGGFLLLTTTDVIGWGFWFDLLAFWPVALIALGLRLVFERSRAPALTLLSPLLVLATMSWVAVAGPGQLGASGPRRALAAERPDGISEWSLTGKLGYGELDLSAASLSSGKNLVVGQVVAAGTSSPLTVSTRGERARVHFGGRHHRRVVVLGFPRARWASWDMELARDLPVDIDLDLALTSGKLDFQDVQLQSLDMDGAFNDLSLVLERPDDNVRIRLEGAFNHYSVSVPEGVAVSVVTDGFLNVYRKAHPGDGPGYRIYVEGAFNGLEVERR